MKTKFFICISTLCVSLSLPLVAQELPRKPSPAPITLASLNQAEMGRTIQSVIFYQAQVSGRNLPKDKRIDAVPKSVFPEAFPTKGKKSLFFGGAPRQ